MILDWIGKTPSSSRVFFHRDDPLTTKSCPGTKVKKDWVLELINGPHSVSSDKPPEKPNVSVKLASSELRYEGMGWFAPAGIYLTKKGVSYTEIKAKLKKKGKSFFYGDVLLEDAFYDAETNTTWVSIRDLEAIKLD
ncbi:MAG: hypothetical protein FJX29_12805 [Alphaproteobacteria bacterium]|nr:hypothetical protein [Alphaproteobacteria bacterium]